MLRKFFDLIFPFGPACPVCCSKADSYGACPRCRDRITDTGGYIACPTCGRYQTLRTQGAGSFCTECQNSPPLFYPARSLGPYQGLLKESVYLFKYDGCTSLARFFGLLLAELYMNEPRYPRDPVLLPVPLSREKLQTRGFNQSELVAAEIGKILNLPVSSALRRVVHMPSQSKLTKLARQEMIKGVFDLTQRLERPDVIVVDDILTTGSTVGECTRVLLASGVRTVGLLTIASGIQENINFK